MSKYDRQSFLGSTSEQIFQGLRIAIVGLGGGGSHIAQQLAHIGVGTVSLFDFDSVDKEGTNLNRLVGGESTDSGDQVLKVEVAKRMIGRINPKINVLTFPISWQDSHASLRNCDVIFGCVDSLLQRRDLESAARRFLTPYIDIGMDVHNLEGQFMISGQMAVSMPGKPCLKCMGILPDYLLAREAGNYGSAGSRPQVIWANGLLASAAVGAFVNLVTPWNRKRKHSILLEYDGDVQTLNPSNKLEYLEGISCPHYTIYDLGDPFLN